MKLRTERLIITDLSLEHAPFMFYLMNTPRWKEFIGDRTIRSVEDAMSYIQKILGTPKTNYWTIQKAEDKQLIGIVSFMKRDYLSHFDIGFALFPDFFGQGFAFEATSAVLKAVRSDSTHEKILATTLPTNVDSIKLLETLGFSFSERIQSNNEELLVFSIC